MKVLVVRPMEMPAVQEIDHTLSAMQELVGGTIQAVYPFDDPVALIVVMLKCPVPHSGVGKAPAFQVLHCFKVLLSAFGGLLLFTGCPLAVALCRVSVMP